jgi:GntR family transcriptional repressor for pyruvate dehydrogenase complex
MKLEVLSRTEYLVTQKAIIAQIRDLINFKNIEPGEKLPSERILSEKLGVSRSNLREAIQKLEFYGLLKSVPQSGTFVANIGIIALNGMIEDILRLDSPDFKSLVETRILLELKTVRLAAIRRTDDDLSNIKKALDAHSDKVYDGKDAVQEDLLFHLSIAKASKNSTMNTLMLVITPQIITNFEKHHVCDTDAAVNAVEEHAAIYEAIRQQDAHLGEKRMKVHFSELYQYCYNS